MRAPGAHRGSGRRRQIHPHPPRDGLLKTVAQLVQGELQQRLARLADLQRGVTTHLAQPLSGHTRGSHSLLPGLGLIRRHTHEDAGAALGKQQAIGAGATGGQLQLGTEGLVVIGTREGIAVALKVLDGSMRATTPVALALLASVGAINETVAAKLIDETSLRLESAGVEIGRLRLSAF